MNDQMFNYNRIPINMNVYNPNIYLNIQNINSEQNGFKYSQYQMNNNNINNHPKNNIDMKKKNNNLYMRNIIVSNNNNKGSKSYQNQNNKNLIPIYNSSINLELW